MANKSSRVQTNLIQQNCYVRDVTRVCDLKTDSSSGSSYLTIDEEVSSDGVKIVKKEVPYHITPEYVSSFADSTDYHRDPQNAILNGVSKPNLGDVSALQSLSSMDSSTMAELYSQLKAKFENPGVEPGVEPDENVDNNNSEVK